MFKKLLSNLPFTPSLIEVVDSYSKFLSKEVKLRIIGTYLLVLALAMHITASIYPGTTSLIIPCADRMGASSCSLPQLLTEKAGNFSIFGKITLPIAISLILISAYLTLRSWITAQEMKIIKKQEVSGRVRL